MTYDNFNRVSKDIYSYTGNQMRHFSGLKHYMREK